MKFWQKYQKAIVKRLIALAVMVLIVAYSYMLRSVDYDYISGKVALGERYALSENPNKQRMTIALITDLHACYYGDNQQTLIKALNKHQPDVILLGGDIYDDRQPFDNADNLLAQLPSIAPTYYVDGNHENWLPSAEYQDVLQRVTAHGVTVLHGKSAQLPDSNVYIHGVADPHSGHFEQDLQAVTQHLNPDDFNILLSHRPELIDTYRHYDFDVILSGHAHGGQWRLPLLVNGLYAPGQWIFPKYAGGVYSFENGKTLIVSRGLARESTKVPRIFNRPELVFLTLSDKESAALF